MPYSSYYIQIFVNNSFLNLITFGTLFRLSDYLQRLLPRNTTTRNQVRSSATVTPKKYNVRPYEGIYFHILFDSLNCTANVM